MNIELIQVWDRLRLLGLRWTQLTRLANVAVSSKGVERELSPISADVAQAQAYGEWVVVVRLHDVPSAGYDARWTLNLEKMRKVIIFIGIE